MIFRTIAISTLIAVIVGVVLVRHERDRVNALPVPAPTLEEGRPLSESFLLKRIQVDIATALARQIGWFIGSEDDDWIDDCPVNGDHWTPDKQVVWFGNPHRPCLGISFSEPRYTDDTQLVYGPTRPVTGALDPLSSEAQRVTNNSPEPDTHHVEKKFDIAQSVESSFTQDMSFDVTLQNETSIQAGSAEAGGKLEDKLTATFGSHFGTSKTRTEAQATDQEDTIADDVTIDAHGDVLLEFSNAPVTVHVAFSVNGYYDFAVRLIIPGWWDWAYGGDDGRYRNAAWRPCFATRENPGWANALHEREYWDVAEGVGATTYIDFASLADVLDVWWGVSTDWPLLNRDHGCVPAWWDDPATHANLTAIEDPERRKIVLAGTQTRTSKTATTMTITSLASCDDPEAILDQARHGQDWHDDCPSAEQRGTSESHRTPKKTR
ncbi:MAG: hypothetical protein F4Y45_10740 [Acidobacteria bacterium]|nr:hypothetical protein [Acidobacteriota bacterium]